MPDEDRWLEQARRGDIESFSRLVELRQGYVRAYLGRLVGHPDVADDLAQEAFLRAYRNLHVYDGRAPFQAWLAGIARNLALEHLRKEARRLARHVALLPAALADWRARQADSENALPDRHERHVRAVKACLDRLPPKSADIIDRFYFKSESAETLASRLETTANAVHQLLFRIRHALRRCVEERLAAEG